MEAISITKKAGICPRCKKSNHVLAPNVVGDVCDECQEELLKSSSIVLCKRCNHIAAWVEHGETESGFVFEPDKTYTTDRCRRCDPNVTKLEINEMEEYLNQKGIKPSDFILLGR